MTASASKSSSVNRREFLRCSAAALALGFPMIVAPGALGAPRRPSPNDRLRVGIIGMGGRARWILKHEALPGADVIAVADCHKRRALGLKSP